MKGRKTFSILNIRLSRTLQCDLEGVGVFDPDDEPGLVDAGGVFGPQGFRGHARGRGGQE